jgi:hypothetical protein
VAKNRPASAPGFVLLSVSFIAAWVMLPPTARPAAHAGAKRAAALATLATSDFRVTVVARQLSGATPPTAEVRAAVAVRVGGGWRQLHELRLRETYFWSTVSGPRAICRLDISTGAPPGNHPHVTIQVLQSPAIGCGPAHRIPLPSR